MQVFKYDLFRVSKIIMTYSKLVAENRATQESLEILDLQFLGVKKYVKKGT